MSAFGPLANRYDTKQKRKILSLDGGGIRGVVTLEILSELEKKLKEKSGLGDTFRLGDYFDYIGGTSTGAIIAAGLSIGMTVQQLLDFYVKDGKNMFDKRFLLKRWESFYKAGPLLEMLKKTFGEDTDMDTDKGKFKCLLLIVTMNRTTDSPWPISNNPNAKYNNKTRQDCNRFIKLYQLIRASAAAPVYFPPETMQWDENDPSKTFVFVDGGVTPYNNPAFLLYRMATHPAYKLEWETGEDNLLILSIGTGSAPTEGEYNNLAGSLSGLPTNLMYAMSVDQDINCRTVGRCIFGAPIDRELHDMIPMNAEGNVIDNTVKGNKHFSYVRYNADLSQDSLDAMGLGDIKSDHVREMDSVKYIDELRRVGIQTGKDQVKLAHLGSFI